MGTATLMPITRHSRDFYLLENEHYTYGLKKSAREKNIDSEKARLRKAAQGFEAIFIRKLLSTMRSTMSEGGMFGNGISGEVYADIVDNAVADIMSKRSALGIADDLYNSMVKSIDIE